MLEFIAGIYQHRPNSPDYLKQVGGIQFKETQINSPGIIQLAQNSVVELFKYTAGKPELDETIERVQLQNNDALHILNSIARNELEIHKAFRSDDHITIVLKINK